MALPNLTGTYIANTYQYLVQKPDTTLEEYYNGVGTLIYINGDPIGTVKMFFPYPSGTPLSNFFDTSTGKGVTGSGWHNWAMADGRNSTPDLRARFIVGYTDGGDVDGDYATFGQTGGEKKHMLSATELPPHRHEFNYHRTGGTSDPGDSEFIGVNSPFPTKYPALLDTINNGGIPGYGSGNGITNDGPTDTNGGSTQTKFENRPPFYTLLYVIKIA